MFCFENAARDTIIEFEKKIFSQVVLGQQRFWSTLLHELGHLCVLGVFYQLKVFLIIKPFLKQIYFTEIFAENI